MDVIRYLTNETKRDLYQEVGKVCRDFLRKTYPGDIIVKFEISYDGIYWTNVICFAEYNIEDDSIIFLEDWWEGESFIRNIKVCHLEDVIFPEDYV